MLLQALGRVLQQEISVMWGNFLSEFDVMESQNGSGWKGP